MLVVLLFMISSNVKQKRRQTRPGGGHRNPSANQTELDATQAQPKCNPSATQAQPKLSQNETRAQPKPNPPKRKAQPKCSQSWSRRQEGVDDFRGRRLEGGIWLGGVDG